MKQLVTLAVVADYHDLEFIANHLEPTAKAWEIGTTLSGPEPYLMYVGVIYTGRKPSRDRVDDLLYRSKIELESND